MATAHERTVVLGLDSMPPSLLFDRFLPKMPATRALLERSTYGTLTSCDPPITVPAWAVMFTGMDPGTLGIYGFRHRRPGTYWDTYSPTPQMLPHPPVWETLSRLGRRVAVIGMPPGYPPPRVNGVYISDFLTPDRARDFVQPPELVPEVSRVAGGRYIFDVTFRADDRMRIGRELLEMTRARWTVARHLWRKEPWDLFALHEIGPDRIHHTFWKYFDHGHPRSEANPEFERLVEEYYRMLDEEIGKFVQEIGDSATIFLLSDHGSQMMDGCFCINEWLLDNGYLALRGPRPPRGTPLEKAAVDWTRTRVWGAGGYYARLFFNVRGREPQGIVDPAETAALTDELRKGLAAVTLPTGSPLGADVREPARVYREVRGDPPDLMVYFSDLKWRSAGTIGYGTQFLNENDTGPDDSVHSLEGIYAMAEPGRTGAGRSAAQSILDVGPTILTRMGVDPPAKTQGKPIPSLL